LAKCWESFLKAQPALKDSQKHQKQIKKLQRALLLFASIFKYGRAKHKNNARTDENGLEPNRLLHSDSSLGRKWPTLAAHR
jgi:hypothetical protein